MGGRSFFRINFHVSIFLLLAGVVVVSTLGSVASIFLSSGGAARGGAAAQFAAVAGRVQDRVERHMAETLDLASIGAALAAAAVAVEGDGLAHPLLPFLRDTLARRSGLYSLYVGFANGDFLQAIAAGRDGRVRDQHRAPEATALIVRAISGEGPERREVWTFLDARGARLDGRVNPTPDYDPRRRTWYAAARAAGDGEAVLTEPYLFHSLGEPGITGARRLLTGDAVFGADQSLRGLAGFVEAQRISPRGGVVLLDSQRRVLAARAPLLGERPEPLAGLPLDTRVGQAIQSAFDGAEANGPVSLFEANGGDPLMVRLGRWQGGAGAVVTFAVVAPVDDFTTPFDLMLGRILIFGGIIMAAVVPIAIVLSRRMSVSLRRLVGEAERIRAFDFTDRPLPTSAIEEFQDLAQAFGLMRQTLADRTHALEVEQTKLERLVNQGIAMATERDGVRLMQMILEGAKELTNADGGTLYIRDGDVLRFQILRNDSLGIALGGPDDPPCELPPVPLFRDGAPNDKNVVSHCVHGEVTVNIPDAYDATVFDFSGTRIFDERNGYRSQSFLTVPLKPRGGEVIGAMQLINARTPDGAVVPFAADIQSMIEALAAQAGTIMDNHGLMEAQERLLDSLIRIIAGAIDAKSPYTGGHCERVPELAFMLAEEASNQTDGPLGAFAFTTEEEWREFKIGAWLHDCGKVVTPEYVVDKATKLETIHNRIHEVRTRFEILHRDATIAYLRGVIAGTTPEPDLRAAMEARHAELREQFAFIAECNVGGEFMAPEKVDRVKEIAAQTWLRHFDDRLGLSHLELERRGTEEEALPVEERLLADKPWHVIPRPGGTHAYDAYGFKVAVPENLYDFGEVYNLAISRGTLTAEERFKINEHIMQTIAMLEELPFPDHLRRVPEYAGTHHETLKGTGYPRALTAAELSVPSRIMAIADIFEALTASDRPYKKPKTLSESIRILSFFRDDEHIDPDLFDLFLTSGVYKRYAERFLHPDQIDEVDITAFLRRQDAPAAGG